MGNGFREDRPQIIHRCIGIGKCLKIGNVFVDRALVGEPFFAGFNLFPDGEGRIGSKFSGTAAAAEDTASVTYSAVPVRTGHAAV